MTNTKKSRSNAATLERAESTQNIISTGFEAQFNSTMIAAGLQGRLALKPTEAARMLGIGRNAIYNLCHRADFPAVRVGSSLIVPVDALRRWLDDQAEQGRGSL